MPRKRYCWAKMKHNLYFPLLPIFYFSFIQGLSIVKVTFNDFMPSVIGYDDRMIKGIVFYLD